MTTHKEKKRIEKVLNKNKITITKYNSKLNCFETKKAISYNL